MNVGTGTRNAGLAAACATLLVCVLILPARARDGAANKSTTTSNSAKSKHNASSAKTHTVSAKHRKRSKRVRGQQKIDSERAQAIQEALIREHYFSGEATGKWDQASETAMRRYQQDNGWQNKTVPDSRALIKLGLGPSNDHLLNPESAMITVPAAPKSDPLPTTSHSSPAVANPAPPAAATSPRAVSSDSSRPQ